MRTVVIRIQGAKRPIHKLQLEQGTKVSDVLKALNAHGYVLARASAPTNPFPSEAEVHALVCDADNTVRHKFCWWDIGGTGTLGARDILSLP